MKRIILFFLSAFLLVQSFAQTKPEFRGVWIASVENIDWPKRGQLNAESQKAEFIRQLDLHERNGMNAVIVQIRPSADAFYPSQYEPWSQWLTGTQGKPPSPFYDPLEFTINETHKRGFEYHAWVNPYRANSSLNKASIAPNHITKLHPEWFVAYGGKMYFDPGNKEAQAWVVNVVKDIVNRYDIDALHMDDYFYPYKIPGKEFPDHKSYRQYGNGMSREDWRRSNIDSIILKLTAVIHETKPWVKFGISPIGNWSVNYNELYANVVLWLQKGWIDYVAPQVYWDFGNKTSPFDKIVKWWNENSYGRHVYVGLGIYRAGESTAWRNPNLIPQQIDSVRTKPNVQGQVYFSSNTFDRNPFGWNEVLRNNHYKEKAVVPDMPWLPKRPMMATLTQ